MKQITDATESFKLKNSRNNPELYRIAQAEASNYFTKIRYY